MDDTVQDQYSINIDEQLLHVVKQENIEYYRDEQKTKVNQIEKINREQKSRMKNKFYTEIENPGDSNISYSILSFQNDKHLSNQFNTHFQQAKYFNINQEEANVSEKRGSQSTYNVIDKRVIYGSEVPIPIISSKLKIYPVNETTISPEGNLITKMFSEQVFQDRKNLNYFIQDFARDNGFGVVIAHSNKKAIYYTCELGGRYRHKNSKKETNNVTCNKGTNFNIEVNTKTKKLRCPFAMTGSFKKSTGIWSLKITCNEHNHPQLDPLSNHPMLRKRSDEINLLILELYKIGTKPSHIELKLKEDYPNLLIKREDIYNEIRGYKRKLKKQKFCFESFDHLKKSSCFKNDRICQKRNSISISNMDRDLSETFLENINGDCNLQMSNLIPSYEINDHTFNDLQKPQDQLTLHNKRTSSVVSSSNQSNNNSRKFDYRSRDESKNNNNHVISNTVNNLEVNNYECEVNNFHESDHNESETLLQNIDTRLVG